MIRSAAFTLTLLAGSVVAAEPVDCFNDEIDYDPRYTSAQPEVLRVTDADIEAMLRRIREGESRAVAAGETGTDLRISLRDESAASD